MSGAAGFEALIVSIAVRTKMFRFLPVRCNSKNFGQKIRNGGLPGRSHPNAALFFFAIVLNRLEHSGWKMRMLFQEMRRAIDDF